MFSTIDFSNEVLGLIHSSTLGQVTLNSLNKAWCIFSWHNKILKILNLIEMAQENPKPHRTF